MKTPWEIYTIKPFKDCRGSLKKVIMKSQIANEEELEEAYLLYSNSKSIRGNHYHKKTIEYFTVVSGTAKFVLKDLKTGVVEEVEVSESDNLVLKIPPYVVHAFRNEKEKTLVILAISTREYRKGDTDSYEQKIL
ncbi:WxcM-like domain-containing protein [Proteinivorax hydrogeniformans]|uniref:WxcM-like domain-containing protein n=1 Tax=Proteinivorax hydrogeniformans TaxID=1826727 RepID=A0AAU8HV71_9FIRM